MSAGRHSNSCFHLLLKPEIRPHTIPRSSKIVACLHTPRDRQHTHTLYAAAVLRNSGKLQRNISQCQLQEPPSLPQCLREVKVHSGFPHLSRPLVHTHCTSGCSLSPLRSLMQTAPNRFEKLPYVPASLPQVQSQMSQTNLFTAWPDGCVKINPHNQSLLPALVQNREFGNFRIWCKKQSLYFLNSLVWCFCSAHLLVSASTKLKEIICISSFPSSAYKKKRQLTRKRNMPTEHITWAQKLRVKLLFFLKR